MSWCLFLTTQSTVHQWWFRWWFGVNTLRPRQNGRHFADDIFKRIFSNENIWILIKISLKFVPKGSINTIPTLVQIMAWRRPGDKPLSEPMIVRLLTHICVTRPQWINRPQAWTNEDLAYCWIYLSLGLSELKCRCCHIFTYYIYLTLHFNWSKMTSQTYTFWSIF